MRQIPAPGLPRVVIVGAGFGGLEAARALGNAPVSLTVVDRNNYHLFQPLLYQVATADLAVSDISAPIRRVLWRQWNTEVLMAELVDVDLDGRRILLRHRVGHYDRWEPYDFLILATGAQQSYFGHDEWERVAPGLKSASAALTIRRKILSAFEEAEMEPDAATREALLNFVLVGGGPTGVEMAGAIAELAHHAIVCDFRHINSAASRIILVEAQPRILATFPPELARSAHCHLEKLGVEIHTQARVEHVDEDGVVIAGQRLPAKTVIWTAGVQASPVGQWLGVPTDHAGRVVVQGDLSVPGHPELFVIGDVANPKVRGKQPLGLAPVAIQHGKYVARAVRRRIQGRPIRRFRYRDKGSLAVIGRSFAVADLPPRLRFDGFPAWLVWLFVHILYLVGFRNRLVVLIQLAWFFFTRQHGARIIVLDDTPAQARPASGRLAPEWETRVAAASGDGERERRGAVGGDAR